MEPAEALAEAPDPPPALALPAFAEAADPVAAPGRVP